MGEAPGAKLDFSELYRRLDEAEQALTREGHESPEARAKVLAARARALAASRTQDERHELAQLLAFRVGGERYAVAIEEVDEVLEIKGLSPLLGAPRQLLGAIVARARVIPVLDLRHLLGLEGGGMSDLTRVVVVGQGGDLFGLAVESIEGKLEMESRVWERPLSGPFLHVSADRLAVLDLAQLGGAEAHKKPSGTGANG